MEIQEIVIEVDERGEVRIEVNGVIGERCLDLTAALERALGAWNIKRTFKPSMYGGGDGGARIPLKIGG